MLSNAPLFFISCCLLLGLVFGNVMQAVCGELVMVDGGGGLMGHVKYDSLGWEKVVALLTW